MSSARMGEPRKENSPRRHRDTEGSATQSNSVIHGMRFGWMVAGLLLTGLACQAEAGSSNSLMDLSSDGKLLACSNRDSGTVTLIDVATNAKIHEVSVGKHPEGVSFVGQSHQLAVAVYRDDAIVFIDADTGQETGRTEVFDEPYGIVSTKSGDRLYVTLDYPGQVIEIDPASRKITRSWDAGRFIKGLALSPDESTVMVTEYFTGIARSFDRTSGTMQHEWVGTGQDNLARQVTFHPTLDRAYIPHQRSRNTVSHGSGAIFPYIAVLQTKVDGEPHRTRRMMDSFDRSFVVANPWEIAVSPDGMSAVMVFGGTDDLFVSNVDTNRELTHRETLRTGSNPRAVRFAADGESFFVYNALDFEIDRIGLTSYDLIARIKVCEAPLDPVTLLGKKLFYSANQPMVGRRWISCSSCHPDGEQDGRVWQQPEGLRDTQPMYGLAWTHPLHWSADRDEVQDFEHTIRGLLMQGQGLAKGPINAALADPNQGLSKSLDALAVYSNSHTYPLSPHAKNGLSESAQRGKDLFFTEQVGCAKCHAGPLLTDSQAGQLIRHDVGTGHSDPTEKMEPAYDTPSLHGVYRSAPYLHHGMAKTLEEVLTTLNPQDKHGTTSHLKPDQIADLVEYLRCLPFEDPLPAAREAGLTPVVGNLPRTVKP